MIWSLKEEIIRPGCWDELRPGQRNLCINSVYQLALTQEGYWSFYCVLVCVGLIFFFSFLFPLEERERNYVLESARIFSPA